MSRRLPACDPCRLSKLSCDHSKPVCLRCTNRSIASECSYRDRPFKKRKLQTFSPGDTPTTPQSAPANVHVFALSGTSPKRLRRYPNPGYLGPSSHTTFFDHLSETDQSLALNFARDDAVEDSNPPGSGISSDRLDQGAAFIRQIQRSARLPGWKALVEAWVARGINLPVAEPFTVSCAMTACSALSQRETSSTSDAEAAVRLSNRLYIESCKPLHVSADAAIEAFSALFCRGAARWETLGLFFTAVSRATIDIVSFEGVYASEEDRRSVRRLAMRFADSCLEVALALDCLNDLQVVLQYENFILHSLVDGDQSYHSWRKLGDVVSSLFALGYHEQLGDPSTTPSFLRELRFVAFSRTYSADKNCSIFLGRPPRMLKRYCPTAHLPELWDSEEHFTYRADTRVHHICASLKEDVLELQRDEQAVRLEKASQIRVAVEAQWNAIPTPLRLEGPLCSYDRRQVEIDFLVSAKINYTHVKFLLELTVTPRISSPSSELLRASAEILSLVVEAIVLKQRLANSGTSLVWKVAYYGLAAAGVLSLALLYNTFDRATPTATPSQTIRDLSVLVAEIETGALLQREDPNFALLSGAASTIKNLLDRLISSKFLAQSDAQSFPEVAMLPPLAVSDGEATAWDTQGLQDFDPGFWLNLSEQLFTITPDGVFA